MKIVTKLSTCLFMLTVLCHAEFMEPDIERVPVDRLIKNIEAKLKNDTKNTDILFTLARVHSLAYAKKTTTLEVGKGSNEPWVGYVPSGIPFKVTPSKEVAAIKAADDHLKKATALYRRVIEAKPDHYLARLGLAWSTQQLGDKKTAIALYRKLVAETLPADRKIDGRYMGLPTISTEASTYLIELLDPKTDAAEIARLKKQSEETEKRISRMITPIAVGLNSDLSADQFIDREASVDFDLDGSGIKKSWQWIMPDAAWLVYDPAASGNIQSGLQMFGSVTFWVFWENGYSAMSALDDNSDGLLEGRELTGLSLWHDRNKNGISEAEEVRPLSAHQIVQIDCNWEMNDSGMPFNAKGVTLKNGETRPTCDVILSTVE